MVTKKETSGKKILLVVGIVIVLCIAAICGGMFFLNEHKWSQKMEAGEAYVDDSEYEEAINAYEEAIEMKPKREEAYLQLAAVYTKMEDYEAALEILEDGYDIVKSEKVEEKITEVKDEIKRLEEEREEELKRLEEELKQLEELLKEEDKTEKSSRTNMEAPKERVFDYADVLTEAEEEELRVYIAQCEEICATDIVLVTVYEEMETDRISWEDAMCSRAEAFYDDNLFGFNEVYGDGVLFLDNWYEGQEGSWIVTSGKQVEEITDEELEQIFDAVFAVVGDNPYEAYRLFVEKVCFD